MEERVLKILRKINSEYDYESSEDFIEDEYIDSFDVIELVTLLEEEFQITINGLEIITDNFTNLHTICKLIDSCEHA